LLLHAIVHPADIQDRDGGILLLATLFGMYPFLKKLFADGGYQGPEFHTALTKLLPQLETEIIKRSDHAKGFVVLPRRWVVERTIAWLNRCRRLAKDWENLNRKALAFLRLASIASCSENFVIPLDVPGQTLRCQGHLLAPEATWKCHRAAQTGDRP
jgi:transposase